MFCNFEVSKKLFALGYNESCEYVYHIDTNGNQEVISVEYIPGLDDIQKASNDQLPEGYISAPLQNDALRWLTWEYDIFVTPKQEGSRFYAYIYLKKNEFTDYGVWDFETNVWPITSQPGYDTTYDAVNAGLAYAIKELLEIKD